LKKDNLVRIARQRASVKHGKEHDASRARRATHGPGAPER
jgi:hypothetical protein